MQAGAEGVAGDRGEIETEWLVVSSQLEKQIPPLRCGMTSEEGKRQEANTEILSFAQNDDDAGRWSGGRDQPHSTEDAGGNAGGDAGAELHGARTYIRPAVAVLCAGDSEPD